MQEIMVFPRYIIHGADGFIPWDEAKQLVESASNAVVWMPRNDAECSEIWVQPIPCAIFRDASGRYCVFRQIKQQRKDLSSRLSFIVGGHIDRCVASNLLTEALCETVKREVWEEVGITLDHTLEPVGMVVDASSLIASKHVGFIYELNVDTGVRSRTKEEFSVRSKYDGRFLNIEDRSRFRGTFDPWSSIIFAEYMEGGFATDLGRQPMLPFFDRE